MIFHSNPPFCNSLVFFGSDVLRLKAEDYMLFGYNFCALYLIRAWHYKLAGASINLAVDSIEFFVTQIHSWGFYPHRKLQSWMGPILFTVTIFFGSIAIHLKAADYVLFGWNSCAICLTRALGSIDFFLAQVNTLEIWAPAKIIILDGAETLSRTHLLWLRHSKLARASNNLAVGPIEFFVARINSCGFEPHQKLHFWIVRAPLFTVTMFFGSHVLRLKAEHYTSSLQLSWLLPTPLWMSIVWHFGSELKSSSGYNPPYRSMAVPAAKP